MSELIDVDVTPEIVARIQATCPAFKYVVEGWFQEPIDNYHEQTPAALPMLLEDGPSGEPEAFGRRQAVTQVYGVWIICERGDEFRARRRDIRNALFGHQLRDDIGLMAYRGGGLKDIRGGHFHWLDTWSVDVHYRHQGPITVTL